MRANEIVPPGNYKPTPEIVMQILLRAPNEVNSSLPPLPVKNFIRPHLKRMDAISLVQ